MDTWQQGRNKAQDDLLKRNDIQCYYIISIA